MIRLPLNKRSLPALAVEADGEAVFEAIRALVADEPLGGQLLNGEAPVINVRFELPGHTRIPLGSAADVLFESKGDARIWYVDDRDVAPNDVLSQYDIPLPDSDHCLLILESAGEARIDAAAGFPAGAFAFGLTADGRTQVRYLHAHPFDRNTAAAELLQSFLRSTHLPYEAVEPERLPVEGEVLAFEYGGYLSVGISAAWGYSVSSYAGAEIGEMVLKSKVDIASSLRLQGGVTVAGDFAVEVRRGGSAAWARVTVRKRRERAFTFAGGLDVGIDVRTEGFANDADQFLEAALELRAPQIARDIHELLVQGEASFVEALHERKNALLEKFVHELSDRWLGRALTGDVAAPLFERLQQVVDLYDSLDARVMAVLEGVIEVKCKAGKRLEEIIEDVGAALTEIVEAVSLEALKLADNPLVWEILRRFAGDGWLDLLTNEQRFAEVRQTIGTLREEQWEEIASFIHARYQSLGLSSVLANVGAFVDVLRQADNPEIIVRQAEKHLLAAAERMTDRRLEALSGTELEKAIDELSSLIAKVAAFKDRMYAEFKDTLNRSHRLAVARSFSRAKENEALVDVEFDVTTDRGRALMRQAVRGHFENLFTRENLSVIRIHQAAFSHRTASHNQLKLDLFGWKRSSFRSLILETSRNVRREGDGLLHIYGLSADEGITRKRSGEDIKLNYLLNLTASGSRADVVESIDRMSAQYTVGVDDRKTSEKELMRYLSLARQLAILPEEPGKLIEALREELGRPSTDPDWGRVVLQYEARWTPEGLQRLVEIPVNQMLFTARETLANIVGGAFLSFYREGAQHSLAGRGSMWHYRVGRLLVDRDARDSLRQKGRDFYRSDASFCRLLDDAEYCIGGRDDRNSKTVFQTYFRAEKGMERALTRFRAGLEASDTAIDDLEDAFTLLAEQRRHLADAMPKESRDRFTDPFFAILDRLVTLAAGTAATRSVLELTLHGQEGTPDAGITKIFA